MKGILKRGKNVIWLFVCGFFIGIFMEIIFIERPKFAAFTHHDSLEKIIGVTCLVLIKHEHIRYVNASRQTWLKNCDDYYVVDVQKPQRLGKRVKTATTPSDAEQFKKLMDEYKFCSKESTKFKGVWEVVAKSGWGGLCKALHITKPSTSQWLIIVPDSLVVLVENLKLFVKDLNSDDGHYYGYALENYEAHYNVLSAGILISRGTLMKVFDEFKSVEDCDRSGKFWKNEDLYLGKYLKKMNIFPKDTRDAEGRGRFHGYNMNNIIWPGKLFAQSDYSKKALYPVKKGFKCCSPHMITVDVSDPDAMLNLYFFLYILTTVHKEIPKPAKINKSEGFFWKDFLREEGYSESAIENMTSEEYYKIWEKKLPPDLAYREMRDFVKNHKDLD